MHFKNSYQREWENRNKRKDEKATDLNRIWGHA